MKLSRLTTLGAFAIAFALVSVAHAQPGSAPTDIRSQAEMRKDAKPIPLEKRVEARKDTPGQQMKIARDAASTTASTSPLFKKNAGIREEIKKKMEAKQFENRKAALVRELTKSLENLQDIVTRIESRIAKAESSGRNMTEPKALLVTAKQKIEKAKTEVNAFKSLTASSTPPTTASTTATTTIDVDLTKPRQLGDAAIKAVKEARDALQKVVVSIAHNMGLGGKTATSTPPTTGTTTPPTGTTTPPTATTTATTTNP